MNGLRGNLGYKLEGSVAASHNADTGKNPDFRMELARLVNIWGISLSKIAAAWPADCSAIAQYSI